MAGVPAGLGASLDGGSDGGGRCAARQRRSESACGQPVRGVARDRGLPQSGAPDRAVAHRDGVHHHCSGGSGTCHRPSWHRM